MSSVRRRAPSYRRRSTARRRPAARRTSGRGDYRVGRQAYYNPSRLVGRGDYMKIPGFNAKKLGRTLGSAGGAAIGNMIAPGIGGALGERIGQGLGEAAGRGFRWLTGFGDYAVERNTMVHPDEPIPSFGPDTIRVRKREFITNIPASVSFSNSKFAINPGLSEVFPWLSAIASNYEQYRWNGLVFEYVSQSAVALSSTDLRLGTVCLASDYNAIDPQYINLPQMLSTMFSNSGRPSDNIGHAVECATYDTPQKLYYVRSGDAPTNSDLRLYDMLSFQCGVEGTPAGTNDQLIGQLWVNYDVTFCKSVQNNQVGFDINTDHFVITATTAAAQYFGSSDANRTLTDGSNIGCTLTNTDIQFPPSLASGFYLVTIQWRGAATANVLPGLTGTNCSNLALFQTGGISNGGSTAGVLTTSDTWRIDNRDAVISLSGGTLPGAPTAGDVFIQQINGELFAV